MKRFVLILTLLTAAIFSRALAENPADFSVPQTGPAATRTTAELLDSPSEDAHVLMRYYPGVRVEVTQCVNETYVSVCVGIQPGALTGYMRADELAYTEYGVRSVRGVYAIWNSEDGLPLYTRMDARAQKMGDVFNFFQVLGVSDEGWMHARWNGSQTGFADRGDAADGIQVFEQPYIYTAPTQDELSKEEAIAYAMEQMVKDGGYGYTSDGPVAVTREELEACVPEVQVLYYEYEPLNYDVTFYDAETGGFYTAITLYVEGKTVLGYGYENG